MGKVRVYIDCDDEVGGSGGVTLDMTCVLCVKRAVGWSGRII